MSAREIKARYLEAGMTALIDGERHIVSTVHRTTLGTVVARFEGVPAATSYYVEEGVTVVETDARDRFIAGLRAMADFYEANPTMLVPAYPNLLVHTSGEDDVQEVEQVRAAAELLGVEAKTGKHVTASRKFGPIEVRVCHVPRAVMADHEAQMSYVGNLKAEAGAR